MAGPTQPGPGPVIVDTGPDVRINPPIPDTDYSQLFPTIVNNNTPNPTALAQAAAVSQPVSNQVSIRGARRGDPVPYIFGRCICEPTIIAANDSGPYLVMDLLWGRGEVEEIEYLIVDGINEGLGTQLGKNQHFTGAAGQIASTVMSEALGETYDVCTGQAHSVLSWLPGYDLNIKAMIKGLKLFDPRTSPGTTAYSTNPALALARLFVDCGYTMDWDTVATAADYCDELIGSPNVKRWEIGGQIRNRQDFRVWVETLKTYANCYVDIQGGVVSLVPNEPRAANHTVVAADMIPGTIRFNRAGSREIPSAVVVNYVSIDGEPLSAVYPEAAELDAPGTITTLQLPFFQTAHTAGRKAEEVYLQAREDRSIQFDTFSKALARTAGDVATLTNAEFGFSSDTMVVLEVKQVSRGRWRLKYNDFDSVESSTIYTQTPNSTTLYNPYHPPAGGTPTLTEELYTDSDGVTYARIKIVFTGQTWAYLDDYRVTATGNDENETVVLDTYVDPLGVVDHTVYSDVPLTSGVTYTVNVYVHSNVDALSSTPGTAQITSSLGNNALLDVGDVTNMHVYILDGDAKYATTSAKTGSPLTGETWASRFATSPETTFQDLLASTERFLENQTTTTVFQTEIWDSGAQWSGSWQFLDLNMTVWGAVKDHYVRLSEDVSPQSFSDNAGNQFSDEARFMIAKTTLTGSPSIAGDGLHVKLPIPVTLVLGA